MVQGALTLVAMAPFEFLEPINLQPLFSACRSYHLYFRKAGFTISISRPANDRPFPIIDLTLVTVGGGLDLTTLIAQFSGCEHSAQLIDLAKFIENGILKCPLDNFHSWRAGQRIHHCFKQAGFFQQNCLRMRCEPDVFLARRSEWFVSAVAVA